MIFIRVKSLTIDIKSGLILKDAKQLVLENLKKKKTEGKKNSKYFRLIFGIAVASTTN